MITTWTNTAQAPSRLDHRPDNSLLYVMGQLGIPECGLKTIRKGIDNPSQMSYTLTEHGGIAGPWDFHPIGSMSYNKNGIDYVTTTTAAPDVVAKGKYIPVHCGSETVHVTYFPNCENLFVSKKIGVVDSVRVVERQIIDREQCHEVDIVGSIFLVLLGIFIMRRFRNDEENV